MILTSGTKTMKTKATYKNKSCKWIEQTFHETKEYSLNFMKDKNLIWSRVAKKEHGEKEGKKFIEMGPPQLNQF